MNRKISSSDILPEPGQTQYLKHLGLRRSTASERRSTQGESKMSDTLATDPREFLPEPVPTPKKKPFYMTLWGQVLFGVALAIIYGYLKPASAIKMKPLGDGFIRLITMVITVIIFCTVVTGIAGMENLKKVGRIGGQALLYFEIVMTSSLLIGLIVGNLVHPGSGWNVN